jgi:putative transposase
MNGLALPRTFWYRSRPGALRQEPGRRWPGSRRRREAARWRSLKPDEKAAILGLLNSPEYAEKAVPQVFAAELDKDRYWCSISTMYRILRENSQVRERRKQLRHPMHIKPELVATRPNQVWTWDITNIPGPYRGVCFYLYVVMDMYSRKVVGWMLAQRESGELAVQLVETACRQQGISRKQLVLHSDRGPAMISKSLVEKMDDLGIRPSLSRPHVSNDNPFSEAQFKTLKYCPWYPVRFGSLQDARSWARWFFTWYNQEHYHSGIGLMHPAVVHSGRGPEQWEFRRLTMERFYQEYPERFVKGPPKPPRIPAMVWINRPETNRALPLTLESVEEVVPVSQLVQ